MLYLKGLNPTEFGNVFEVEYDNKFFDHSWVVLELRQLML